MEVFPPALAGCPQAVGWRACREPVVLAWGLLLTTAAWLVERRKRSPLSGGLIAGGLQTPRRFWRRCLLRSAAPTGAQRRVSTHEQVGHGVSAETPMATLWVWGRGAQPPPPQEQATGRGVWTR